MELPFAALQQLCAPMLELVERLAPPQREALSVAFGLRAGGPPSPFLVGLAVLGLLSDAAEKQPLLCVVDDAHWLDDASARALGFVARRLLAERIALLFAAREIGETLGGLPALRVEGLHDREARALLASVMPDRVDERVLERIIAEARGNPLALLELPKGLYAGGTRGRVWRARGVARFWRASRRVSRGVSGACRTTHGCSCWWRPRSPSAIPRSSGVRRSGSESRNRQPTSSRARVCSTIGNRMAFRHPLVRSAVYRASASDERREVHRALAEATDPQLDPDRRAWHWAQATSMPDESVAAELERSAGRARARGGPAAVAAFLERAAALTPDSALRAQRLLMAAGAKRDAGDLEGALGLLEGVEAGALDELGRARVDLLRARIALEQRRGDDAGRLFLSAASRLEPRDPALARETYLEALGGVLASDVQVAGGAPAVAAAARVAPRSAVPLSRGRRAARRVRGPPDRWVRGRGADPREGPRASTCGRRLQRRHQLVAVRLQRQEQQHGRSRAVGRRGFARPRRPPSAAGSRHGRTRAPAVRAHLPGEEPHARRRADRGHLADRRSTLDRRGDRKSSARERPDDSGCLARPGGERVRADRSQLRGSGRSAMGVQQLREIRAVQRPRAVTTPHAMPAWEAFQPDPIGYGTYLVSELAEAASQDR